MEHKLINTLLEIQGRINHLRREGNNLHGVDRDTSFDILSRRVKDLSDLGLEALHQAKAAQDNGGWLPIESAPKDGTPIMRPHINWGAMAVRHKRPDQTEDFLQGYSWMSSHYGQLWPEEAFLPFWQPLPPAPKTDGGA